MISRTIKIFGIALIFMLLCSAVGMAGGFGGYAGYDLLLGVMGWYENWDNFSRVKIIQCGIMMDTNVAKDSLFNYRLKVGVDISNASFFDQDEGRQVDMTILQLSVTNTFGFGILRSEAMRVFFGPQVGISFGFEPALTDGYYSTMGNFYEMDIFYGVALGLNIHLTDSLSLTGDISLDIHNDVMASPAAVFIGYTIKTAANVGVLIKFNDTFVPRKPRE